MLHVQSSMVTVPGGNWAEEAVSMAEQTVDNENKLERMQPGGMTPIYQSPCCDNIAISA